MLSERMRVEDDDDDDDVGAGGAIHPRISRNQHIAARQRRRAANGSSAFVVSGDGADADADALSRPGAAARCVLYFM